ncbi:hypothetical protein [Shewanella youngdeokensis]|uniref:DUF2147 domain-containing protein n=1 Tax=Shewanella youngdeokensis TaxID=2999068 RepID=A0ABZ0JV21_9GAMM|nr:hypothetical protein RGE70_12390 [Shewanella sp. DAU334]
MKRLKTKLMFIFATSILTISPLWASENPFIGSWELVSGKYLDGKGQWVHYSDLKLSAIKVISAHNFSFTTMKNIGTASEPVNEFWAAGSGPYIFSDTEYTEFPQLNSFGVVDNKSFSYRYVIHGSQWQTMRVENGELKEQELWHKID